MNGRLVVTALAVFLMAGLETVRWLRGRYVVVNVQGMSMRPTYEPGDRLLVTRRTPDSVPKVGSVVVFRRPELGPRGAVSWTGTAGVRPWMVKRVVAVAGQPVPARFGGATRTGTVPDGTVLVLGDNAAESSDSRTWGPVPVERVLGPVVRVLSADRADGGGPR